MGELHKHPHVIELLAEGDNVAPGVGGPYLALEFCAGGSLGDFLTGGGAMDSEASIAGLFAGVADGLSYVHGRKCVHRDLKPVNILLDRTKPALEAGKLADWGSAVTNNESGHGGSVAYAAPEWFPGPDAAGGSRWPTTTEGSGDIYSLGLSVLETVRREAPFAHLGE